MAKFTYHDSGPALERIAREEGKKQYGAESTWLSDTEFARFQEAVMPMWEEWEKKSPYCAQLVKIAKEFAK
jgi:TRAP-type C4-dicarboxylate transport system substrate-binding protein